MLKDQHNRIHDYLRISLTDSCNFRCTYCMPEEDIACLPQKHLMQPEEIEKIAETFVALGVNKIRLTGGEPLVRKEVADILDRLSHLPVELTMTTNGVFLDKYLANLKNAGLRSLNISIDTLDRTKFFLLTKRDQLEKVWTNIQLMIREGFRIKLNVVAMKGINDDEILDFIKLTTDQPLHVRFIEFMPFTGNQWEKGKVLPTADMLAMAEAALDFVKLKDAKHDTSKKYKIKGAAGTFAFITTMSQPFCGDCNRMRLTADGKMKNCLFGKDEIDLLSALRNGQEIASLIQKSLFSKHAVMGGQFKQSYEETDGKSIENRSMIKIGG
ncbi:GTP 3',8-cyclase MoaA [Pararhodonellum marinum]|uniref:GTP 3',8-cyclase MoaA n=1 Tax=Pararhodonellum marinum TaxID=2755358 RepID=UPI00188F71FE|nr:GTP 3',8-cyclase MoaA [Pararhodonellum marinum]